MVYSSLFTSRFLFASIIAVFVYSSETKADAYNAGTFSFKPINVDVSSFTLGRLAKDSRFRSLGIAGLPSPREVPVDVKLDAFRSPASYGFNESDRNGTGYGIELGYLLGMDWELFGRAGFCRERGKGNFIVGDQRYVFNKRQNYGLSLGLRKYIDVSSSEWKPFIATAFGFVNQGKTKARVNAHSPFSTYPEQDPIYLGKHTLLGRQNLFTFEISAGTDYVFHPNWALSASIAVRYNQRGGSKTTSYPAVLTDFFGFQFPLPPRDVVYSDNKQRWYVPLVLSLKCIL